MVREIRDSIDAAFKHDPAARSTIEVLLCYPGVHAVILAVVLAVHAFLRRRAASAPAD